MLAILFSFPFTGQLSRGHQFCKSTTLVLLVSILLLTVAAIWADKTNPAYQKAVAYSDVKAKRSIALASGVGIPKEGTLALLRADPLIQGPNLFRAHCSSCHRWDGHDGTGFPVVGSTVVEPQPTKNIIKNKWTPQESASRRPFGG